MSATNDPPKEIKKQIKCSGINNQSLSLFLVAVAMTRNEKKYTLADASGASWRGF